MFDLSRGCGVARLSSPVNSMSINDTFVLSFPFHCPELGQEKDRVTCQEISWLKAAVVPYVQQNNLPSWFIPGREMRKIQLTLLASRSQSLSPQSLCSGHWFLSWGGSRYRSHSSYPWIQFLSVSLSKSSLLS